jgi:uncharacterized protein
MIQLELWYLLPASIVIATIAMSSGIGGAVFFAPLFILVLKVEPTVAIGTALITELFGFSSGLHAYSRQRLIDYHLGRTLLMISVPFAIAGSLIAESVSANLLKGAFAAGIIFIGIQLFLSYRSERLERLGGNETKDIEEDHTSQLVDRDGTVFRYTVCAPLQGMLFAAIGGMFLGMISVGLAELQEYRLVARCRIPTPVAVGTSIFVVVVTVLFASLAHIYRFATNADPTVLQEVGAIVIFTIPGVVIGGQIGPWLQSRVDPDIMKISIAVMFVAVGCFMFATLAG